MACKSCGSDNQQMFGAEINIHFPGQEALDKPAVLIFPELVVCFRCGFTEFTILETELHRLAKDAAGVTFESVPDSPFHRE
jgi:hypothetical protein